MWTILNGNSSSGCEKKKSKINHEFRILYVYWNFDVAFVVSAIDGMKISPAFQKIIPQFNDKYRNINKKNHMWHQKYHHNKIIKDR